MTKESLNKGIVLHSEIKALKYVVEAMEQQPELCIHLHRNLGEDICIKDEALIYEVLRLFKDKLCDFEKEFKEL